MAGIQVGDSAPDLTGTAHDGTPINLHALCRDRAVVLYFYPKDGTVGCTRQACSFRDAYEDFTAAGGAVIGVSNDDDASHRAFAAEHRLPFPLLSDSDGTLRRTWGVPKTLGLLAGRVTYVMDREAIVRHIFDSQLFAERHMHEALATVRRLRQA